MQYPFMWVANDGEHFSDQRVPVYFLERALKAGISSTVTVPHSGGLCDGINNTGTGFALAAWVLPQRPSSADGIVAGGVLTLYGTDSRQSVQLSYVNQAFSIGG